MNPKSTILLVLIALGLGLILFLRPASREPGWTDRAFPDLSPGEITEIVLERTGSPTIEFARAGGPNRWLVARPVRDRADPFAVARLLEVITGLPARGIDERASDSDLGLASPRIRLRFRAGSQEGGVDIGHEEPFGKSVYARIAPRGPVVLLPRTTFLALELPLDELRDRTVLPIPVHLVRSIQITRHPNPSDPGEIYRLERGDAKSDWHLTEPVNDPADTPSVLRLLDGLRSMRALSFRPDSSPPPPGLSPPRWVVDLELEEGIHVGPIEIGPLRKDPPEQIVRIEGREPLLVLDPESSPAVPSLGEIRSRRLIGFSPAATARIVFHRPDGSHWTLRRTGSGWQILGQTPDGSHVRHPARTEAVKDLLKALAHARITGFVADGVGKIPPSRFDLSPARVAVQISHTNPADGLVSLFIGSPVPENPSQVHAQVSNRPESILTIDSKLVLHLIGTGRPEWSNYLEDD